MLKTAQLAFIYFLLVFAAGFVLGAIRVLFIVDMVGERYAELAELPLMMIVTALAAKRVVNKHLNVLTRNAAILVGMLALALMLLIEFTLVLWLRGIALGAYLAERDPVSGLAYLAGLVWFAAAPLVFYSRKRGRDD